MEIWDVASGRRTAEIAHARGSVDVSVLPGGRIMIAPDRGGGEIWRRIRPERWWGVFWLPHFWIIAALAAGLAVSGWRDLRRLRECDRG